MNLFQLPPETGTLKEDTATFFCELKFHVWTSWRIGVCCIWDPPLGWRQQKETSHNEGLGSPRPQELVGARVAATQSSRWNRGMGAQFLRVRHGEFPTQFRARFVLSAQVKQVG